MTSSTHYENENPKVAGIVHCPRVIPVRCVRRRRRNARIPEAWRERRNASALKRFEEAKRRFDDFMAGRAATIEEFDEAAKPFGATQKRPVIGW